MELNYRTLTDAEMRSVVRHAHNMRADAIREMGQAIGAYVKARVNALKNFLNRPAHKAA